MKFGTFSACYGWLAFLLYYWLMHIFFKKTTHSYGKNAKLSPRNFLYCVCFDTLLQRACYRQESAKLRGLHGNVGYVGAWIAWVKFLRGLNGLRGSKYFLLGSNIILCGSYRRSKIFAVFFFFVDQPLFSKWDYFSILQLIVWAFFFRVSSQQILTKPCLTSLVFLSGLIEICKTDEIQWHFYEHVTKFSLWAANWPYSQRGCEYSQISRSSQALQASFENSTPLRKLFHGKNFPKECCIMP